ncbi:squalene--hopene cyclase [Bacillus sp. B1-b2]|uniref:squalene--hopene cyclase n=1 Tax=Bacillus sp. B1-b2 TaxID=2653201 RepID=UPI001261F893|nr:squalene--hopene cyclase [Bacillus sp. B1-b2]KAB7668855.1 squalene--hopene cyclase [Bacillus sp. B1-b2]
MDDTVKLVRKELDSRITQLQKLQHTDGSFRFRFQGSLMTDAFFIITIRALDIHTEEPNVQALAKSLRSTQHKEGYWKAYSDEPNGHLSATVIAYTALLYSGYYQKEDALMKKAASFIQKNGGIAKAHFMIKWMLSVNGLYPWSHMIYIPMTFLLLPTFQPINFYQFSAYARIHFIPILIAANKKFSLNSQNRPNVDHLYSRNEELYPSYAQLENERSPISFLWKEMKRIGKFPSYLHHLGFQYAEKYMLERLEEDGTLYSYASSTFFMIYALLALGYKKESPTIQNALTGLSGLIDKKGTHAHLENSTSTVWDTALISYTLQQADLSPQNETVKKATTYLLSKQHTRLGDWHIHNPNTSPGGWGFSHINTNNPDNDDTSATLRALTKSATISSTVQEAWQKGTNYLLSMQNKDGGWGAFEKNTNWEILNYVPIENAKDAAIDPSTADLTGRVLEYLGNFANLKKDHPHIKQGVDWLLDHQEEDGSWYGRWGVCYIYGTWAAITGLIAVGVAKTHPAIQKALTWLKSIQLKDGGWGESCQSCEKLIYIPLTFSTDSQTAWAIDALLAGGEWKSKQVEKGVNYLIAANKKDASIRYPTGIGLPGQFYIYYHSYNKIFPLIALSHYVKKWSK